MLCTRYGRNLDSLSFYSDFTIQNPMDLLNDAGQYLSMKETDTPSKNPSN